MRNCNNRYDCSVLAVTASIIIGITTAILRYTAIITVSTTFLWVAFGIAVGYLALALFAAVSTRAYRINCCVCEVQPLLLIGVLLTLLTSVVLLAITFAATSVLGALITGALLGAFSLIFTSAACYIKCLTACDED